MAKGSHATYGGWEQKLCCLCGKKIVLSDPGAMYYFDYATQTSITVCELCLKAEGHVPLRELAAKAA